MKEQNIQILNDKVIIKRLNHKFALELMKHNFFTGNNVLNHGVSNRILQVIKFIPYSTKLVAYHTQDKIVIGFLCLEENMDWLYSIKYVFVDPKYRKMGIGTGLLNYATILAKEKGAKKINLNVYLTHTRTRELYKKQGFKEIGFSVLGQGFLSGSKPLRVIKRSLAGIKHLIKRTSIKKGRLFNVKLNSRKNRETLFNIYQNKMDQKWIDFFEINVNNLINGSRNVWQPPFFKNVLINDVANSFALIFNLPFSSKATVELYSISDAVSVSLIKELLKILSNRGISLTQITLFNTRNNVALNWFEENRMKTFQFISMGKML